MDRNLVTVIFCLLIAGSMNTFAQRHYKNISALEMNYGSNIFGDYGHYGNLSFSKYVNRKSYWKAGISYFEKPYDYAIPKQTNYGSNIFGDYGHYGNLSFSKYVNRKSYWKAGISYFEKPYDYAIPKQTDPATPPATPPAATPTRSAPAAPETPAPVETEWADKKAWDLHLDGSYYYTIVTNLKSVYWSVGLGAFIGCEFDKRPDEKYTFIVGPKLETELEVFVAPRIALLGRVQQFWNPLSVEDWNTVWNVGIKFLLY